MKHLIALSLLVSLAACSGDSKDENREGTPPIELRRDVDPGPSPWDAPTGMVSKSIHYADFNTVEGTTYMNGAIVVDNILAHDGDDVFSVNVRIHNTTDKTISGVYQFLFKTRTMEQVYGHKHGWEPFVVEAHGYVVLSNDALIRGAVGFNLLIDSAAAPATGPNKGQPDAKPAEKPADQPKPEEKPAEQPKPEEKAAEKPAEPPKEEPKPMPEPPKEEPPK
jgi:hypothetical protein